jgi:hypothetical protein
MTRNLPTPLMSPKKNILHDDLRASDEDGPSAIEEDMLQDSDFDEWDPTWDACKYSALEWD